MVSPPRQVVIDDSNSQIHYVGSGWFQDQGGHDNVGNYGPTYQKTSHGTKGNGSISFSFVGSSVAVWGTTGLEKVNPRWRCFVDGMSMREIEPNPFPDNNQLLCQQETMPNGPHTITINVTSAGSIFWFDYITFTPSPASSHTPAVLLAQNTDSDILYEAGWTGLNGDANVTTKIGSRAQFSFVGTSLTWVGYIPHLFPHSGSTASYSIDNGASTSFTLRGLSANATIYNQAFFTTPYLDIGLHTIIVTYEGSPSSTPLTLDYLLITDASSPLAANTSVTTSSAAIKPGLFTPTSTATASPMPHSSTQTQTGPIIGGVIGGLAAAILLFIFWWWRRRRALHLESGTAFLNTTTPSTHHLQAEPFTLSYPLAGGTQPPPNVHSESKVSNALPNNDRNHSSVPSLPQNNAIVEDIPPPMYTAA